MLLHKFFFLDLAIDPCASNDCDPTNGECVPLGNTFLCICKAEYTGKNCTRNVLVLLLELVFIWGEPV